MVEALLSAAGPFALAVRGGAAADRAGFAFAAGYQAVLCALVPDLPGPGPFSLAATEAGGAQPLLQVADGARRRRLEAAWGRLAHAR